MKYSPLVLVVILLVIAQAANAQPMLRDQRYLNEFPTVERIKAEVKGSDNIDTYARFVAAVYVINWIMINDLRRAPNGGYYDMPPVADRVHDKYRIALTYYEIDRPEPPVRDPRYRPLRTKYEDDPAFIDWVLLKFFSPKFRSDYYAWTGKQIPPAATVRAIDAAGSSAVRSAPTKVAVQKRVPCPKVSASGRSEVEDGESTTFTASITDDGSDTTYTYNWMVSAGTISSGQGTSAITVDTTGWGGMTVTATVEIGGMERNCSNSSSSSTGVTPKTIKLDEFGTMTWADRKSRLDNLAIGLQNDPTVKGYIISYAGRRSAKGAAAADLKRMETYLALTRGIDLARIVALDGGYREAPMTELWIVPQGSTPPKPSPTIDPSKITPPATKKPVPKKKA